MKYKVMLRDKVYEIEVESGEAMLLAEYEAKAPVAPAATVPAGAAPSAAAAPAASANISDGEAVTAPMPGNIIKVNFKVGDKVKAGDELIVLEAMKMENEILSPRDGVVAQVLVDKNSRVDTGDPLIVLA